MKISYLLCFLAASIFFSCNGEETAEAEWSVADTTLLSEGTQLDPSVYTAGLPLEKIKLPEGFKISVFAEVPNARSIVRSPNGTIYVGNRAEDKVYAVRDTDGDWIADEKYVIAEGLKMPNGVAWKDGYLYVAEVSKIHRFPDIDNSLDNPKSAVIYDEYPTDDSHGWKYIAFGPDGKLYVPVGAPCNICKSEDPVYASITRMDPDGSNMEIYVEGVRNTVGFDWNPETGNMWFTDNGRDMLGNNIPPDELNKVTEKGQHFGYPFCHGKDISDPEFGGERPCSDFVPATQRLGPHVAALGMKFYTGNVFPEQFHNQIFIPEHGSWNRSEKIGYRVTLVNLDENQNPTGYKVFAQGWLQGDDSWGRPVCLLNMPDGSMLLSDDQAGVIYRIWYEG
ncbi:MAG: PQQ-dependent sugar dehydrogenase [Candidatus Cyclobacteriaceae bacterium M2_1C_046]